MKVPYSVLVGIQTSLDGARSTLESTAASAPGSVDAGDLSALVTDLCARLAQSAAGVSNGAGGAAGLVGDRLADYQATDGNAAGQFRAPGLS